MPATAIEIIADTTNMINKFAHIKIVFLEILEKVRIE